MRPTKSENLFKKLAVAAGVASAGVLLSLPAVALESLIAQSGTSGDEVNPANPDAVGGEAFEDEPTNQPLPSETTPGSTTTPEGTTPDGMMMDEGAGGGAGGVQQTNPVNPANPDAEGGDAFERNPSGQPLPSETTPDSTTTPEGTTPDGMMMDEGAGGGAGGVQQTNPVNPANPDAEGGDAFERTPSGQPLPSGTTETDDFETTPGSTTTPQGGTTTDDGVGGGAGGGAGAVRALW
jgi:hypothetical protein